jgi:hypothetical protein
VYREGFEWSFARTCNEAECGGGFVCFEYPIEGRELGFGLYFEIGCEYFLCVLL